MAQTTVLKAIAGYFNSDPATKKPLREFTEEVKALSPEEKREMAEMIVALTGDTLPAEVKA